MGPENLVLREPPRTETNQEQFANMESVETAQLKLLMRATRVKDASTALQKNATAASKLEKAAFTNAMQEARNMAPSRGRGKKRLVGEAEKAANKSASLAAKLARDECTSAVIKDFGFSNLSDLSAEAKNLVLSTRILLSDCSASSEALRDADCVTAENVELFVNLYATAVMHRNCEAQLRAMRDGLLEFVPPAAWGGFSPMDFELLVGGSPNLTMEDIRARTHFQRSGSEGGAAQIMIQNWFWAVVAGMTPLRRTKLLYFATGSTHLPRGQGRALTVEVFTPNVSSDGSSTEPLPTSATCSRKMMLPAYSTMATLRRKVLLAIEHCDNYELN
jgi:hypothetical protein